MCPFKKINVLFHGIGECLVDLGRGFWCTFLEAGIHPAAAAAPGIIPIFPPSLSRTKRNEERAKKRVKIRPNISALLRCSFQGNFLVSQFDLSPCVYTSLGGKKKFLWKKHPCIFARNGHVTKKTMFEFLENVQKFPIFFRRTTALAP